MRAALGYHRLRHDASCRGRAVRLLPRVTRRALECLRSTRRKCPAPCLCRLALTSTGRVGAATRHLRALHVAHYSEAVTSQAIIEQLALSFFSLISRRHGPESRFRTAK